MKQELERRKAKALKKIQQKKISEQYSPVLSSAVSPGNPLSTAKPKRSVYIQYVSTVVFQVKHSGHLRLRDSVSERGNAVARDQHISA